MVSMCSLSNPPFLSTVPPLCRRESFNCRWRPFDRDMRQEVTRRELIGTAWAGGMGGLSTNEMQVSDTAATQAHYY